jgi:uncharacterized LabA/DUF88 family protein
MEQRIIVYVDGFNFYNGLKATSGWKRYYWIDMVKLFESFMRPNQQLVCVKYFSARSQGSKASRQDAFFQANMENPKFRLILGRYQEKKIPVTYNGSTIFVATNEEKETDVRIATQIVWDIHKEACDASIIVSADSDMIPAIEIAQEANHPVFVYFPPSRYSSEIASMGIGQPTILKRYEARFRQAVMPDVVHIKRDGFSLSIPEQWKNHQA